MKFLQDILHLVFPRTCPGCATLLADQDGAVCMHCLSDIAHTDFHLEPDQNELFYRFGGKVDIDGAVALYYFDKGGKCQQIVSALKYKSLPQVGQYLAEYYATALQSTGFFSGDETLIPVPLHRQRKAQRGYNQSEAIVEGLLTQIPTLKKDYSSLRRARKTTTQTRKSRQDRYENMLGKFTVSTPVSGDVVLVDDIITTGATLEACIRTLQAQPKPPTSIRVLALGMAR